MQLLRQMATLNSITAAQGLPRPARTILSPLPTATAPIEPRTGGGVRVDGVLGAAAEAPGVQVPRVFAIAQRPPPPDPLVPGRPCARRRDLRE